MREITLSESGHILTIRIKYLRTTITDLSLTLTASQIKLHSAEVPMTENKRNYTQMHNAQTNIDLSLLDECKHKKWTT